VKTKSQVVNIGVITRSRSLKGGSGVSTKENPSDKSSPHSEKSWTVGKLKHF
jgi:hypothetical protein